MSQREAMVPAAPSPPPDAEPTRTPELDEWATRLRSAVLGSPAVRLGLVLAAGLTTAVQLFRRFPAHIDMGNLVGIVHRMLQGERLYRDIIEPAPPMFFLLATPAVAFAQDTGLPPLETYNAWVLVLMTLVGALTWRVAGALRIEWETWCLPLVAWAFLYVYATYPGECLGQKEYTAELLVLPYVVAAAALAGGRLLPRDLGLLSGALVGISLCIKPYFAFVWLLIEAALFFVWRRRAAWRRAESQGVVLAGLANLAVVVLFFPDYGDNIRMASAAYGAFIPLPFSEVLLSSNTVLLAVALLAAFAPIRSRLQRLRGMLGLGTAGFILSALAQGKGWQYHWNAAEGFGILALTAAALDAALAASSLRGRWRSLLELLPLAGLLTFVSLALGESASILRGPPSPAAQQVRAVTSFLSSHAGNRKVAWIAMDLFPAQPSMTYAGATSVLKLGNLWPIPGLYPEQWGHEGPFEYHSVEQMPALERRIIDSEIEDLQRSAPDVIVVEGLPHLQFVRSFGFNTFDYFMRDPRFREVLGHYHLARNHGGYRYFVRAAE